MHYFEFINQGESKHNKTRKIHIHVCDNQILSICHDSDEYDLVITKNKMTPADIQDIGYLCGARFLSVQFLQLSIDKAFISEAVIENWLTWLSFGLALSRYKYQHTSSPLLETSLTEFVINTDEPSLITAFNKGKIMAKGQLIARELMNKPGNVIYPSSFVEAVKEANLEGLFIKTLDEKQMKTMGFGGLLAISQGSKKAARLLEVEYRPSDAKAKLVLVGKGVTFDAGGISIKPARFMSTMKMDMGGAAAVVGALYAISQLKLPIHVIGLCGLVENMPSGQAIKPGDVVTMHSGKSVEIITTDAEGRMVLADVLTYAQSEYKPDYLIDIATLTGATGISLGKAFASLMGNDDSLIQTAKKAGEICCEPVWHMPMADALYEKALQSDFADIRHGSEGSDGSASVAATFLNHFVSTDQKWIHIDSAAMSQEMTHRHIYPNAASGFGVLLLTTLAEQLENEGK